MELGKSFPAFSFTLLEIDTKLGGDLLFEFHDIFRECARGSTGETLPHLHSNRQMPPPMSTRPNGRRFPQETKNNA